MLLFRASLLGSLVLVVSCTGESRQPPEAPGLWAARIVSDVQHGRCGDALTFLQAHTELKAEHVYYSLHATASEACFTTTKDRHFLTDSLAALEEGLKRYPKASTLMVDKAMLFLVMGQPGDALTSYKATKRQALENVAADKDAKTASEDRDLLKHIDSDIARVEAMAKQTEPHK